MIVPPRLGRCREQEGREVQTAGTGGHCRKGGREGRRKGGGGRVGGMKQGREGRREEWNKGE